MPNIFIESQGDIDFSVRHCINLSKTGKSNWITLAFPSDLLYNVFIESLHAEAEEQGLHRLDMNANIILPPKEDNDGECTGHR